MRIKTVALENVRSHKNSKVSFEKGFNCLIGGLGTGKSSILYAIDFAFFGDPLTRSYNYLLREEEEICKVVVEFLVNGVTYRIERGLKKTGKGISQDAEELGLYRDSELIANMRKEAVSEELASITGLDREVFREVVWVRQEHLKELLNLTPRERQKRLDQLFRLSDYEVAWNNMRGIQREYEGEKRVLEKDSDVVGLDKLEADYHQAIEEFSVLESEILKLSDKLQDQEDKLQNAATKLQNLEQLRSETEKLLQKEAEIKTNIANSEERHSRLSDEINEQSSTLSELKRQLESYENNVVSQRKQLDSIGLSSDASMDDLDQQILSFNEQITSIKAEEETARKEVQTSKQRVVKLQKESKCPLCLQTLPEDYKTHMLEHIEEEEAEREVRLEELHRNVQELERLKNITDKAIQEIKTCMPRIADRKARLNEEKEYRERRLKELEKQQIQTINLREELEKVTSEISKFNLSELETAKKLHAEATDIVFEVKTKLRVSENRKKEVTSKIEDLKIHLENAEQKAERVEKVGQLLEIIDNIRNAYRSIQPKLRTEFVKVLERMVQQTMDSLTGEENYGLSIHIDETYTPYIRSIEGHEREVQHLSGGERTLLAFAFRLALGQLIMQARTSHGLPILLLDEPTESLGREDRSVDRLAEAISRMKSIEQIIAVTHNEAFAEKAEYVIRLEKEANISVVASAS
jgi:exonuclease SbcC